MLNSRLSYFSIEINQFPFNLGQFPPFFISRSRPCHHVNSNIFDHFSTIHSRFFSLIKFSSFYFTTRNCSNYRIFSFYINTQNNVIWYGMDYFVFFMHYFKIVEFRIYFLFNIFKNLNY